MKKDENTVSQIPSMIRITTAPAIQIAVVDPFPGQGGKPSQIVTILNAESTFIVVLQQGDEQCENNNAETFFGCADRNFVQ